MLILAKQMHVQKIFAHYNTRIGLLVFQIQNETKIVLK